MSGSVLLDSNVGIDHWRNRNGPLVAHLESGGLLFLPLTALGELHAGVARSSAPAKTMAGVTALLQSVSVGRVRANYLYLRGEEKLGWNRDQVIIARKEVVDERTSHRAP